LRLSSSISLRAIVEGVGDDEPRLVLQLVQADADRLRDKSVNRLDRVEPGAHVE
jgi:hypothetical protein